MTAAQLSNIKLAKEITDEIINNSIRLIDIYYSPDYYKQNPHLLSSVIQTQKAIYLELNK